MKKKRTAEIPDFSRKRPQPGVKGEPVGGKSHTPDPRQPQKPPTKSKNGGRRGT